MAAGMLTAAVRTNEDVVSRWGGEEFVLLLPDTTLDYAFSVIERIREKIAETPILVSGRKIHITTSFGLASGNANSSSLSKLLANADIALYDSNKRGRNQTTTYRV